MAAESCAARVCVIIPAHNEQGRIGATVGAARSIAGAREVIVVDDGSTDATADEARRAGARVISLRHAGKGAALRRGVAAAAEPLLLLLDADLGASAARADALVAPVAEGRAQMTIAVLPSPPQRPGFGLALGAARIGLWLLVGRWFGAPLSGQRCMTAALARAIPWARGFGAEVGATCDAAAMGARILEVPVEFDHPPTGRTWAGFMHRARQLAAVVTTLTPRAFYPISPEARPAPRRRLAAAVIAWAMLTGLAMVPPWVGAAALAAGAAVAFVVAALAVNHRAGMIRANYLGRAIPAAGGLGFALGPLALWAWLAYVVGPRLAWEDIALGEPAGLPGLCALGAAVMCAAGLADDVYGSRRVSGLAGHVGSLLRGRITTGAVKAAAGVLVGLVVGFTLARGDWAPGLLNAAIIALSANLVNLLDVRPGRALKGFVLLAVVATAADPYALWALAPIGVVALAFAPLDLGGRAMMGDAGANPLGAAAGIACAFALPLWGKAVLAAALGGIHLYSERRSLSDLIARAPALRWLDQLGRAREEVP